MSWLVREFVGEDLRVLPLSRISQTNTQNGVDIQNRAQTGVLPYGKRGFIVIPAYAGDNREVGQSRWGWIHFGISSRL